MTKENLLEIFGKLTDDELTGCCICVVGVQKKSGFHTLYE